MVRALQGLKPMLEKLAEEYAGRFLLAKVNSDENPELASISVCAASSVKVLFQGQLVDEFNGVLPESQIRDFLDRIALPAAPAATCARKPRRWSPKAGWRKR